MGSTFLHLEAFSQSQCDAKVVLFECEAFQTLSSNPLIDGHVEAVDSETRPTIYQCALSMREELSRLAARFVPVASCVPLAELPRCFVPACMVSKFWKREIRHFAQCALHPYDTQVAGALWIGLDEEQISVKSSLSGSGLRSRFDDNMSFPGFKRKVHSDC